MCVCMRIHMCTRTSTHSLHFLHLIKYTSYHHLKICASILMLTKVKTVKKKNQTAHLSSKYQFLLLRWWSDFQRTKFQSFCHFQPLSVPVSFARATLAIIICIAKYPLFSSSSFPFQLLFIF